MFGTIPISNPNSKPHTSLGRSFRPQWRPLYEVRCLKGFSEDLLNQFENDFDDQAARLNLVLGSEYEIFLYDRPDIRRASVTTPPHRIASRTYPIMS